jgi:hypothetical protein
MLEFDATMHATVLRTPVHAGRVLCPLLGAVDIERCLECSRLVRLEGSTRLDVVCSLRTGVSAQAEDWEEW